MKWWRFGKRKNNENAVRYWEKQKQLTSRPGKFRCHACGATYESWKAVAGLVSNPSYKDGNDELAKVLLPLEYKALYALCISCIKMLDQGFHGAIEAELDRMPAVWGVLACCVDHSGGIVLLTSQFNYTRPVNMIRLRMIKSVR